ncbi:unnamed protein product [Closterium sp. Yama58-4]|nr:unnamed protein product [Closterium sp. Yama58-4]
MQGSNVDFEQLSSLVHLTNLTSLFVPSVVGSNSETALPTNHFFFAQLQSLESLRLGFRGITFDRMFPVGSACIRLKRLNLVLCSSLQFPDEIGELLPSLQELTATFCTFRAPLPQQFTTLRCLYNLILSACNVLLPGNFGKLPALKTLALVSLPLSTLPATFCQLTSLETLVLSRCQDFQQLPRHFSALTGLKTLCFMKMPDLSLPEGIGELANLQTFILRSSNTGPFVFPPSFSCLSSLARLELDGCLASELPQGMGSLTKLQEVYIHSCPNIRELPESIVSCMGLQVLSICDCSGLSSVPRSLDRLTRLTKLELSGCNQLTAVPERLPGSLEVLGLGNKERTVRLPDISTLTKLKQLSLGIINVTDGLAVSRSLSNLKHLALSVVEGSTELPFPLAYLSSLRSLTIRDAGSMKKIPEDLSSTLQHLRALVILRADELKELPESITELQQLRTLRVHTQNLACLPAKLYALSRLRTLDLSDCSSLICSFSSSHPSILPRYYGGSRLQQLFATLHNAEQPHET